MKFGYARVSTREQNLDAQLDALKSEGCQQIFQEKVSGAKKERPELQKLMKQLREGDELIVWKLDRLGRSLPDLVDIVNKLKNQGVGFKCIKDSHIDTTTPQGTLIFHIFASLADFEREIIRERTKAGLTAARARGRLGGRPKGLSQTAKNKAVAAANMYNNKDMSIDAICQSLNVSRSTLYRYLRHEGVKIGS